MATNLLPAKIKDKRVFVAGGYAIYCPGMLWAVNIAERLAKQHRFSKNGCRLWGHVVFRNETFYWIRFAFLRNPAAYDKGQIATPGNDQPALF